MKKRIPIIEMAVGSALNRKPINIMDITKVYKVAEKALADGADNDAIIAKTKAFVDSITVKV